MSNPYRLTTEQRIEYVYECAKAAFQEAGVLSDQPTVKEIQEALASAQELVKQLRIIRNNVRRKK
jgi:hypothetical protein